MTTTYKYDPAFDEDLLDELFSLVEEFRTDGLDIALYRRMRHLCRLTGMNLADVVEAL